MYCLALAKTGAVTCTFPFCHHPLMLKINERWQLWQWGFYFILTEAVMTQGEMGSGPKTGPNQTCIFHMSTPDIY